MVTYINRFYEHRKDCKDTWAVPPCCDLWSPPEGACLHRHVLVDKCTSAHISNDIYIRKGGAGAEELLPATKHRTMIQSPSIFFLLHSRSFSIIAYSFHAQYTVSEWVCGDWNSLGSKAVRKKYSLPVQSPEWITISTNILCPPPYQWQKNDWLISQSNFSQWSKA